MSTLHEIATKIVAAWDAGDKQHLRLLMELLRHALEQQGEPVAWYSDDWKIICRADERVFWKSVAKNPLYAGAAPAAQPVQGERKPFGTVTIRKLSQRFENHSDQYQFYPAGVPPYLDNVDECVTVYSVDVPQVTQPCQDGLGQQLHIANTRIKALQGLAARVEELEEQLLKHREDARKVIEQMVVALEFIRHSGEPAQGVEKRDAASQAGQQWLKENK